MSATDDAVAARLRAAHEQFEALKRGWHGLGLPFSQYSSDFPVILLIALYGAPDEELVGRLRSAAEQHQRLRSQTATMTLFGSDALVNLALAMLDGSATSSVPSEEPVATATHAVSPVDLPPPVLAVEAVVLATAPVAEPVAFGLAESAASSAEAPVAEEDEQDEPKAACPHIGKDGKCKDCTEEDKVTCASCDEEFPESQMEGCKDDDCENWYCPDCVENSLNDKGYCDNCNTYNCDNEGCEESMEAESEIRCSVEGCKSDLGYCEECAKRFLNADGKCMECSGEEEITCNGCDENFTKSRTTACSGECNSDFCAECASDKLTDGKCEECNTPPEEDPPEDTPEEPPPEPSPPPRGHQPLRRTEPPKKSRWNIFG